MSVKSAVRVLRIFELLSANKNGLSIKEISVQLGIPQSSTSELVKTLVEENYVMGKGQQYYLLGPRLIPIGHAAMESLDLAALGTEALEDLMRVVEETVFMATLVDQELVYLAKIDSNRSIRTSAYLGGKKTALLYRSWQSVFSLYARKGKRALFTRNDFATDYRRNDYG